MFERELLVVACAVFAGGFAQGASGFGLALIAVPITAGILPLAEAVPTITIFGACVSALVLLYNLRGVLLREALTILLASLPGILLGVAVVTFANPKYLPLAVGLFVIAYALYALLSENLWPQSPEPRRLWPGAGILAGFLGGFCGGASALNGPAVVLYGAWKRWPKENFKGTLQCYFVFNNIFITSTYFAAGAITSNVQKYLVAGLPALLVGSLLGHMLSSRLNPVRFRQALLTAVLLMGIALVLK